MVKAFRTQRIKKISVTGWKEIKWTGTGNNFNRKYIKRWLNISDSIVTVSPSRDNSVSVLITGHLFNIPDRTFKNDIVANNYAKRVMKRINVYVKNILYAHDRNISY